MNPLKVALVHLNVRLKQPDRNRQRLVALCREAARRGARIVATPELAVSGYSFNNRDEITPFAENEDGPTLAALADVAREFGIYACIGLAEIDLRSGILYNSAFVLGPEGKLLLRYRKINAESRWACPGDPKRDNTFDTPWGRVGVLICSDSYHGLMPRVTALRGADLLIVPANWPPSGIDPRELWRARALENGLYLAACNRTGVDRTMDCRKAPSYACDPCGRTLLDNRDESSQIFLVDMPLTAQGRIDHRICRQRMADRRPQHYRDCYLNLRPIPDLTAFLKLPQPGWMSLGCIVPERGEHPADSLERTFIETPPAENSLYLLPSFPYRDAELERIRQIAARRTTGVLTCRPNHDGRHYFTFRDTGDLQQWPLPRWPFGGGVAFPCLDIGTARLLATPFAALSHPELAISAAKKGCDLALCPEEHLSPEQRLLAGARTIENLAVAICAGNDAGIWMTPEGHQRWEETAAGPGENCRYALDTRRTRRKRFQDQIDFERLLASDILIL